MGCRSAYRRNFLARYGAHPTMRELVVGEIMRATDENRPVENKLKIGAALQEAHATEIEANAAEATKRARLKRGKTLDGASVVLTRVDSLDDKPSSIPLARS